MRRLTTIVAGVLAVAALGCPSTNGVECQDNTSCDLSAGGVCTAAPSGSQWCAYPDPLCPGGLRYSDFHTGDGLAGACVTPEEDVDAGVDAPVGTWSAPEPLELDSPTQAESGGSESPNALELYFDAPQGPATFISDIFYVTRTAPSFAWGANRMAVGAINTAENEGGACISPDGREMYFRRAQAIHVSKRGTLGSAWGASTPIGIDGGSPDVLADGLTMYYFDSSSCLSDLCRVKVTRRDTASAWGNPVVETINEGAVYQNVDIAGDGLRALLTGPSHTGIAPIAIASRLDRTSAWGMPVPIAELAIYTGISSARWSWDERSIYLSVTSGAYDLQVSHLR